jgi:hypothetical protein
MEPVHFIDEPIDVAFNQPPILEKKPTCPDEFIWHGQTYRVEQLQAEWFDFERRGKKANNMRPTHASRASIKGSWGVGRYFFRVQVEGVRIFELYYDRAPVDANRRKGSWFLLLEREVDPQKTSGT